MWTTQLKWSKHLNRYINKEHIQTLNKHMEKYLTSFVVSHPFFFRQCQGIESSNCGNDFITYIDYYGCSVDIDPEEEKTIIREIS